MKNRLTVHVCAFITILIWGSGFPFTRMVGDQISSLGLSAIRCFLSAAVMIIIGLIVGMRKPFRKFDLVLFFITGICGFSLYLVFFNLGLETLDSATGSIITAISPILVAMAATRLYGEKINKVGWFCIFGAFAGVVILLTWGNGLSISIGAVWMLMVALVFTVYSLLTRKLSAMGYTDIEITAYSTIFGAIQTAVFLPEAFVDFIHADTSGKLGILYLGIFAGAIAYFLWGKALALTERTSEVTNYLFVNPLVATIIGFLMLKEMPDAGTYIGGVIIIISVVLFSMKGQKNR